MQGPAHGEAKSRPRCLDGCHGLCWSPTTCPGVLPKCLGWSASFSPERAASRSRNLARCTGLLARTAPAAPPPPPSPRPPHQHRASPQPQPRPPTTQFPTPTVISTGPPQNSEPELGAGSLECSPKQDLQGPHQGLWATPSYTALGPEKAVQMSRTQNSGQVSLLSRDGVGGGAQGLGLLCCKGCQAGNGLNPVPCLQIRLLLRLIEWRSLLLQNKWGTHCWSSTLSFHR